ncbi:MAG: alpha/beta fold hydrolase [Candidatus Binataceae bacterium]
MPSAKQETLSLWSNQIKPRVFIAGSGAPLVYFHGGLGLHWGEFLDTLARQFTVYAPEFPGTTPGDQDGLRALDDWWDLVLYHYEMFDALRLSAPAVAGHGFGAMLAAEIAATDPARAGKLALMSAMGLWRDDTPIRNFIVTPQPELAALLFMNPDHPMRAKVFPDVNDVDAVIKFKWTLACVAKFIWPIPDKGLKKRLGRITAPTLVVWGKQDKLIPPVYANEFASRIKGAKVELIDGGTHMLEIENSAAVAKALTNFLK